MKQMKEWTEQTIPQPAMRKRCGKVGLVLVQSVCCTVLVVLFWLFKVLGGDGFVALKAAFHSALENNVLMETMVGAFAERPADQTVESTVPTTTPTTDG